MITPINGRYGRMSFNGVTINVDSFNGNLTTDEIPVTGFEDQDAASGLTPKGRTDGITDLQVTVEGFVNAAVMPSAVGFAPGAVFIACKFFLDKTAAARWVGSTRMMVFRLNYMTKVDGAWRYSVDLKNAGGAITNAA